VMTEMFHKQQLRNLKTTCARCEAIRENLSNAYCNICKAAYMREYRPRRAQKLLALRYENERLSQELHSLKEGLA
jgi:hypothetical protein